MKISNFKFQIIKNPLTFALLTLTFNFALLTFNLSPVGAFTMSNSNYILQMGNFNMSSGKPTDSSYKLSFTAGQTAPGLFSGTNYQVKSGFQYIYPFYSFAFSISSLIIDFGTLSATYPVTRTNQLTISNSSAYGYSVTAFENHQLMVVASGQLIPDTTCDAGTCSQSTAALWADTPTSLTYGFGYRCDNISDTDCSTDFLPPTYSHYYKQFADDSKTETPQTVMTGAIVGKNKVAQISYKVNVSNMQAAGTYSNVITYIATPSF